MTSTAASPDLSPHLPDGIVAGGVLVALAASAGTAASPAPGFIKIAPRGRVTTRNGESYSFDPEGLSARFNQDDVSLPIDFEHSTVHLAAKGQRSDAIGWIDQLEARADGIYGRVDWLDAGKAALAARTHRYVSPTFHRDADGNATWLHSVALVTAPALANMPALAHAGAHNPEKPMNEKIAAALGLAAGTSEAAILSAIAALKTKPEIQLDPAKLSATLGLAAGADEAAILTAIGALKKPEDGELVTLAATRTELATTRTELAALQATVRKGTVDQLLDAALAEKRIVPAQRESYATLCATDDGLKQVTALLAATPPALGASGLDGKNPGTGEAKVVDPVALAAQANAYLSAQSAAGNPISFVDAFAHAQAEAEKGAAK